MTVIFVSENLCVVVDVLPLQSLFTLAIDMPSVLEEVLFFLSIEIFDFCCWTQTIMILTPVFLQCKAADLYASQAQ